MSCFPNNLLMNKQRCVYVYIYIYIYIYINSFHFLCVVRMYYILFHNFLSNNLFYLFSKLALCCYRKILLIIYSLNLALCLHLAISSFLLFNNFFGSGKSKMWIFFFKTQVAPTIERFGGTRSFQYGPLYFRG